MDFETTSWTRVYGARENQAMLHALTVQYQPAIRQFIGVLVRRDDLADDLTQEFLADKFLNGSLVERAERSRGRFRSFLAQSVRNFVKDHLRRSMREQRGRMALADSVESARTWSSAEQSFDQEYARLVIEKAVENVRQACHEQGMERQWRVFESRMLMPATNECEQARVDDLLDEQNQSDRQQIYTQADVVRKKVLREFRKLVARTVADESDVTAEMDYLLHCLSCC